MLVIAAVVYPLMSILQMKDLKKIDPFRTLLRVKGEYEEDEMLPTGGMSTISGKWETRQMFKEIGIDSVLSIGIMMYLMWLKEYVTPDFFHFVICLGEDAAHSIWIIFLWLTFKCYFAKPTSHQHVPDNLYQVLTFLEGLVGLLLSGELRISTIFIFTCATAVLMLRLRYSDSLTTPLFFFLFIYLS